MNISFALRRSKIFVRYRDVLTFLWTNCSVRCSWRHTACLVATCLFPILNTRNHVIDQQSSVRVKRNLFLRYTRRHDPELKNISFKGDRLPCFVGVYFDFRTLYLKTDLADNKFSMSCQGFYRSPAHSRRGGVGTVFLKIENKISNRKSAGNPSALNCQSKSRTG